MRYGSLVRGFGLLTAGVSLAAAQTAPSSPPLALALKPGSWEVTTKVTVSGQLPPIETSGMTPAERDAIDAAAKAMLGTHTNTDKQCITPEKLQQGIFLTPNDPALRCQPSIRKNTATAIDARVNCSGAAGQTMTSEIHLEAKTPDALSGTTRSQKTQQGRTLKMDATVTGRWIAAACGDVR